jgi:hypothetical protein
MYEIWCVGKSLLPLDGTAMLGGSARHQTKEWQTMVVETERGEKIDRRDVFDKNAS